MEERNKIARASMKHGKRWVGATYLDTPQVRSKEGRGCVYTFKKSARTTICNG